jgi:hypothetical protein
VKDQLFSYPPRIPGRPCQTPVFPLPESTPVSDEEKFRCPGNRRVLSTSGIFQPVPDKRMAANAYVCNFFQGVSKGIMANGGSK